jgi:hypothetical protein
MSETARDPAARLASLGERARTLVEEGVLCGIIGAAVVAVFFLLVDSLQGHPLWTPSLLGSVLFLGEKVDAVSAVSATMVFAYTGVHVLLFLLAGVVLAWMVSQVERNPQFGLFLVLLFLLFQSIVFGFEVTLVPSLVGAIGAGIVAAANLLSAAAMFWYLLHRHPEAVSRMRQGWGE